MYLKNFKSKSKFVLVAASAVGLLAASPSLSCTTFSYGERNHHYVGKSYDWDKEQGVLYTNKRGVRKSSLQVLPTDRPLSWTSKYGSITLNQYGRELPNAGMNEAGLVVEVMVLGGAKFPRADEMPSVNESQWVQYMLDMAGSVSDVVTLTEQLRLSKILIPLHYMVCDKGGACIAVEPLNGKTVITDLVSKGNKALTNDAYGMAMEHLKNYQGFGGTKPIPNGRGSLDRFVIASNHIKKTNIVTLNDGVKFGFDGIDLVASGETKWRVVYDISSEQIYFATESSPGVKLASLKAFNFDCRESVKVFDMSSGASGDVSSKFADYSADANSQLVRSSLGGSVPEQLLKAAESLPETTQCLP